MKTFPLIVSLAAGLFTVTGLQAQTTTTATRTARTTAHTSATISSRNSARLAAQQRAAARASANQTLTAPRVDGSVVRIIRAARTDNPLQMINPAAPAEYGDGRDVTRHYEDDPYQRPQGLKLFAFEF